MAPTTVQPLRRPRIPTGLVVASAFLLLLSAIVGPLAGASDAFRPGDGARTPPAGRATALVAPVRSATQGPRPLGTTNQVIANIAIPPSGPTGNDAIFDPSNGYIYLVANDTNLTVINGATNQVVENLDTGQ